MGNKEGIPLLEAHARGPIPLQSGGLRFAATIF